MGGVKSTDTWLETAPESSWDCSIFRVLNFALFGGVRLTALLAPGCHPPPPPTPKGPSSYIRKTRTPCLRAWTLPGSMDMLNELCWSPTVHTWPWSAAWLTMMVSLLAMMVFRMEMTTMGNTKDMKVLTCRETEDSHQAGVQGLLPWCLPLQLGVWGLEDGRCLVFGVRLVAIHSAFCPFPTHPWLRGGSQTLRHLREPLCMGFSLCSVVSPGCGEGRGLSVSRSGDNGSWMPSLSMALVLQDG